MNVLVIGGGASGMMAAVTAAENGARVTLLEKKEQLDTLASMGCDFIQGYFFSKPLPQREFVEFIRKNIEDEVVA